MGWDLFLKVEMVKEGLAADLKFLFYGPINTCYFDIHLCVLHPEKMNWKSMGDIILSALQPYISKGYSPLTHFDEKVDKNFLPINMWKCHIPYLYSPHYVKELDDLLIQEKDKESYDRLSKFPPVMIKGEEFNVVLKKLKEGIKDKLISSGCEIYHDFNENEMKEK